MNKKILVILAVLLVAAVAAFWFLQRPPEVETLIPAEAQNVIVVNNLQEINRTFKESNLLKGLTRSTLLQRVRVERNVMFTELLGRKLAIATFIDEEALKTLGPNQKYPDVQNVLFIVEVKKKSLLDRVIKSKLSFKTIRHGGITIKQFTNTKTQQSMYLCFIDNLLVTSDSEEIIKKALDLRASKKKDGGILSNKYLSEILDKTNPPDIYVFKQAYLADLLSKVLENSGVSGQQVQAFLPFAKTLIDIFQPFGAEFTAIDIDEKDIIWRKTSFINPQAPVKIKESFQTPPQKNVFLNIIPRDYLLFGTSNMIFFESILDVAEPVLEPALQLGAPGQPFDKTRVKDLLSSIGPQVAYCLMRISPPRRFTSPPQVEGFVAVQIRKKEKLQELMSIVSAFLDSGLKENGLASEIYERTYSGTTIKGAKIDITDNLSFNGEMFEKDGFLFLSSSPDATQNAINTMLDKTLTLQSKKSFSNIQSKYFKDKDNGISSKSIKNIADNINEIIDFYTGIFAKSMPGMQIPLVDDVKNTISAMRIFEESHSQIISGKEKVTTLGVLEIDGLSERKWKDFFDSAQNLITYLQIMNQTQALFKGMPQTPPPVPLPQDFPEELPAETQ